MLLELATSACQLWVECECLMNTSAESPRDNTKFRVISMLKDRSRDRFM